MDCTNRCRGRELIVFEWFLYQGLSKFQGEFGESPKRWGKRRHLLNVRHTKCIQERKNGQLTACGDYHCGNCLLITTVVTIFPDSPVVKNPPTNAGDVSDLGSALIWEDSLEKEMAIHSSILLGNPMDRGAGYIVHGVAKNQTRWSDRAFLHTYTHSLSLCDKQTACWTPLPLFSSSTEALNKPFSSQVLFLHGHQYK